MIIVIKGVPWWLSRLKIQHCACHGSGYTCGAGGCLGTYACHGHSQKKKKVIVVSRTILKSLKEFGIEEELFLFFS